MSSLSRPSSLLNRHGLQFVLLFAFVLTALLVLQQQRTIESQRVLIRQLFQDSLELNQMRMNAAENAQR
jgi:hypothetical protein